MTVTEPNITSPVEEAQPQKTSRWAAWRGMWFFPVAVLWMELVLRISTIGFDYPKGLLYTFGFSLAAGVLLALLGKAFSPKAGRIIVTALWGIFSIFYMGQVVYYAIFKVYFTLFSVGGAGQVAQFASVIFSTILQCWWALLLMLVPIALLLWQGKSALLGAMNSGKSCCGRLSQRWRCNHHHRRGPAGYRRCYERQPPVYHRFYQQSFGQPLWAAYHLPHRGTQCHLWPHAGGNGGGTGAGTRT